MEGVLTRRSCKADPVAALAWWDHLVDPGPGRPVALVKVKGVRQDPVPSEGTWGEVAAGFLAGKPGLRPYGPEDVRWLESGGSTASRRVQPKFPIRLRHLAPQRCLANVSIDPTGTPTQVEVVGCHQGFVYETIRAVSEWRWDVPEADPAPPSWVTTVPVVFQYD